MQRPGGLSQKLRSAARHLRRLGGVRCRRCYLGLPVVFAGAVLTDLLAGGPGGIAPFGGFYAVVLVATLCGGLAVGLITAVVSGALLVTALFLPGLGDPVALSGRALLGMFTAVSIVLASVLSYAQMKRRVAEANAGAARAVIDASHDAVFVRDAAGRYLMCNSPGEKLCQSATARGEPSTASVWSPVRDVDVLADGAPRTCEESLLVDGRMRDFIITRSPYQDKEGRTIGVVGIARDVTEHEREMRANRFLAEATATLGSSLEYGETVAAVTRAAVPTLADGCVVHVLDEHDGSLHMLAAYHRDPAKMAVAWDLERRFPVPRDAPRGAGLVVKTGRPELISEIPDEAVVAAAQSPEHLAILRKAGVRSFLCVPMPARGRTLGAMSFAMVESGRRYEPEDVPLFAEIARRAGIAIDHARMYATAQHAIGLREEFLSIASHELRTPLTALRIAVERLVRNAASDHDGSALSNSGMLGTVERSTRRLTQLVDDLMNVSRFLSHDAPFEFEEVDAGNVVRQVISQFGEAFKQSRCRVTVRSEGCLLGRWNRERLAQVVTNLLSNAVKYGAGQPIEISVEGDDDWLHMTVTDHGIGIPAEAQSRIFERFERAVSERHYGGFGLGLWIVRRIVAAFGGTVAVESEMGKGARFTVELPRRPRQMAADNQPTMSA